VKDELADECDYSREASFFRRYGAPECLGEDVRFKVPWVWPGSTERVLVMEHMEGVSIGDAVIGALLPEKRHEVCKLLYLFQWSFRAT
jgi:aarF domain-containing kinase